MAWNNYPPEIAQVTQLVAQYTSTARGQGGAPASATTPVASGWAGVRADQRPDRPPARSHGSCPTGSRQSRRRAAQVQEMIAAGNQIIDTSYSTERNARNMLTTLDDVV